MIQGYLLLTKRLKGQVLSFDLLLAIVFFALMLTILIFQVSYNTREINELREKNHMLEEVNKLSDIFFREGYPKNWDQNNVEILGLQTNNRIDWNKLKELENIGYQKSLVLLGMNYDYNITIQSSNINWTFGRIPPADSTIVKTDRLSILNSSLVSIRILVFKYD